jgi:acyl-CoA synthetase (AMP-forming)/AMP-acid ligase II/alkylation response protein AidB-like acyl-CoA dehydrogenase
MNESTMTESTMTESILNILRAHEVDLRDKIAFTLLNENGQPQQSISYQQLAARSWAIAAELLSRRLTGERALLLYPTGFEFLAAFFGCLAAGVIAVPAPPPESTRQKRAGTRLKSIIEDCDARVILTSAATLEPMESLLTDIKMSIDCLDTESIPTERLSRSDLPGIAGNALAYLQYTSGSTSTPKGIEITHTNLVHHLRSLQRTCNYTAESVTVTWMPNYHDWGLIEGLIEPFVNGTPCYLMSPFSFVRRPRNWLAAMSQFQGTHSQGPCFAYEHCVRRIAEDQLADLDLSRWRAAGIAAEPINFQVMQQFYEKFNPCGFRWHTFSPAFGLGEATLMVSFCDVHQPPTAMQVDAAALEQNVARTSADSSQARTVVSCGTVYADTDVQIVDPIKHQALPAGSIGEIWIRSPAVARGYWRREEETAETFGGRIVPSGAGPYLRTGDLGFVRDGELYVTGRLKDLIIIRGSNHYPQDIEWTSQRADEAFAGRVAAAFSVVVEGSERLVVLQEIDGVLDSELQGRQFLAKIAEAIAEHHEIDVFQVLLLKRGAIPRTASGKIQRRASRSAYLGNELEVLAQWREDVQPMAFSDGTQESNPRPSSIGDEQAERSQQCADGVITWLREYSARRVNSLLMDQRRMVAPHIMLEFGNHGLFGLQLPRQYGGLQLKHRDMTRVIEQVAAIDVSLATLVFLSNTNGLRPILNFGSEEIKGRILPGLAAGRQLAAFALTEPCAGANIGAMEAVAVRQGSGGWKLTGTKRWNGSAWSSWVTVIARESDAAHVRHGISAFLVSLDAPGVSVGEESLTAGLRAIVQNSLSLRDVFVPAEQLLGESGRGLDVANDAFLIGRLCVAATSLGAMKRCLQLLYRYASRRQISTGRLIDHPHVMARVDEIHCYIDAIQTAVEYVSGSLDEGKTPPGWLMMVLKVAATEYLNSTAGAVVQLLGGRGYMENNEVSRIWRDAKSLTIGEGPNESLIGFLGQPQSLAALLDWLSANSCGGGEIQSLVATSCEKILECSRQLVSLTTAQREQWAHYLAGTVAIPAILDTIVHRVGTPTFEGTRDWIRRIFQVTMEGAQHWAQKGPATATSKHRHDHLRGIGDSIGDLHQVLPGEDFAMDPLLEPGVVDGSEPAEAGGADVNARDSRQLLEAALRERLARKNSAN